MLNENLNNTPNWKQKLETADSFPGEAVYNKKAAWEKLHARLGGKTRRKKPVWYWMAAACITFALIIPLVYSIRNNQQQTTSTVKEKQVLVETSPTTTIEKKDSVPVRSVSIDINQKKSSVISHQALAKMNDGSKEKKLRLTYTVSPKNLIPEMESNFITPIDTLSSLATIQPEKKKLKVVHINELGEPAQTLPDLLRNSDKHTFQFKIASQEIYINPATASNTNGFTILKIKPSQN